MTTAPSIRDWQKEAIVLLEEALYLRMYGERPPGGEGSTWAEWDCATEGFLRDRICAERGHDPEGRCCPSSIEASRDSACEPT